MDAAGRLILECVEVPRVRPRVTVNFPPHMQLRRPLPAPLALVPLRPRVALVPLAPVRKAPLFSPPRASGSRPAQASAPGVLAPGFVYKGIIGGPPSIIPRNPNGPRLSLGLVTSTVTRSTTQIRTARVASSSTGRMSTGGRARLRSPATADEENRPPRVPRYRRHSARAYQGSRVRRAPGHELAENDMYLSAARPPEATSAASDLTCGICLQIKSHPVRQVFVVLGVGPADARCQWLEHSFQCPQCRRKMTSAPVPDDDVAAAIVLQHPFWKDESRINYSWTGLTFPIPYPVSPIV
ncbi:hypothetical protein C8F04DRAFT_1270094 [Mycena alexandri]|uniref:Uncharacterized protein n=1 Tax=Mycena alexandri TaxID=1745969 RepID=A0AAD6S1D1_9AGAR|nr:hypothetical protein C8F04DRAFT_1277037 [Mycena alexandri]KAJ7024555.1 hypothetical protein C8F04DRAFT_1270094 [Mycena alexandri]